MSSNIIVFKAPDVLEIQSNKTEREILYEKFKKTSHLQPHHFDSFMEMENYEESVQETQSTIPSILIKTIMPFCIPIIKNIPEFTVKPDVVEIFKHKKKAQEKKKADFAKTQSNDLTYIISVQLEYPIRCYLYNKNKGVKNNYNSQDIVTIPTHETFDIIGVLVPSKIVKSTDTSQVNYVESVHTTELLISGAFGLQDFQSGNYTQTRVNNLVHTSKKYDTVHFTSPDDAKKKIESINKRIRYTSEFYERNLVMLYKSLYTMPLAAYLKNQNSLYNIFNPAFHKKESVMKHSDISKQLSKLLHVSLGNSTFSNEFIFDTFNVFDIQKQINILGANNPTSKKLLQTLDKQQVFENTIIGFNKLKFKKKLEYAKKKAISQNKFNTTDLTKLTQSQRKIIDLEFDKLEKFYQTIKDNGAEFDLVNTLFWAMDNGKTHLIKESLNEIESRVKLPKSLDDATELLQTSKKIALICPHVIAKARQLISSKNPLYQSGIIREHLIAKFSLPVSDDGYYCRICGELLADADVEEIAKYSAGKRISFVVEHDALKSSIWKDIVYIMTVYVKFKDAVNQKKIISSMVDALRPEMGFIESNLLKIRSNSKDSIKDLMSIYITTYAFAMIVNMIDNNYGKITFTFRPSHPQTSDRRSGGLTLSKKSNKFGGKSSPKDKQKRLQNIINNALFIILRMKTVTISESTSISIESIKPMLIKAYKWSTSLKYSESSVTSKSDDTVPDLETDNLYNYIKYMQLESGVVKPNIKQVLGRTWAKIETDFPENKSLYETAAIPNEWGKSDTAKYNHGSYKQVVEYVKNKVYNTDAVPYSNERLNHDKKYEYLAALEDKLSQSYLRASVKPFNIIKIVDNFMLKYNNFKPNTIKIDKYFDNAGHPHTFDIFVYQKANNKGVLLGARKEYTKKDIVSWVKSDSKKLSEFKQWFIVDEKCSTCGVIRTKTKNTSVEKAIKKLDDIQVFYNYYENRCPKGELHDYVIAIQKNKESYCKKCNLTAKIFKTNDIAYHNKYIKKFNMLRETVYNLEKRSIEKLMNVTKHVSPKLVVADWRVNNSPILELSRKFNIKYNTWINLGLSIGQPYASIENGLINPSTEVTTNMAVLRNVQLYNYYLYIVATFYLIKNYDISKTLTFDLKQIMSKNKVSNLREKLIDLDQSVLDKFKYYKRYSKPSVLSNFMLYTISITILNIFDSLKKAGVNVAKDATLYIIKAILLSEKLVSKPDLTKFATSAVIANTVDVALELTLGNNEFGQDDDGDSMDKSLNQTVDFEPDNEFELDDMDIEQDNEENTNNNAMGF